jgi:hypothetical protein
MFLVRGPADVAICVTIGVGVDRKWIIIEEGKRQYVLCVLVLVKG